MAIQQPPITVDEFWEVVSELPDDRQYELIEGIITEMPPSSTENSMIAMLIGHLLLMFIRKNNIAGVVLGADGGYVLSSGNVRVPDVSYISADRYHPKRIEGGPDLAVEIISPSETSNRIIQKIQQYFDAGTQMVWTVHPEDREVQVYTPVQSLPNGMNIETLTVNDTLTAGDVLPGFAVAVKDLFEQPEA